MDNTTKQPNKKGIEKALILTMVAGFTFLERFGIISETFTLDELPLYIRQRIEKFSSGILFTLSFIDKSSSFIVDFRAEPMSEKVADAILVNRVYPRVTDGLKDKAEPPSTEKGE